MILRLNSNLALQQAKNAVLAAFIIGVLLSVPQIVFSIRQEQNLVNKTIEQALQTLKDSASESAYYVDANLADKVVDGLFQYKSIIKAEITASFGTVAAQRSRRLAFMTREPGSSGYKWWIDLFFENRFEFEQPLFVKKAPRQVGILRVRVDPNIVIAENFVEDILFILGSGFILYLALALILFAIFYYTFTKPLKLAALEVAKVNPEMPQSSTLSLPPGHEKNELGRLIEGFNGLLVNLGETLNRRETAEQELSNARDDLEIRVEERTRKLRREITERKYMESALRNSEERFRDIAECASDWFWEMDKNLRFTFISEKFFEITQVKRESVIGKTRLEILKDKITSMEPEPRQVHQDDMEKHRPFTRLELAINNDDGDVFHILISGKPLFGDNDDFLGYRGAGRDVTSRWEWEEQLNAAMARADQASQAKSDFLASMSHELRTPLNGILGFSQLLEFNPKEPLSDNQSQYVGHILHAGNHLLDLINQVLDLAKIETGNIPLNVEPIRVNDVVAECQALLQTVADSRKIKLTLNLDDPSLLVSADYTRLKQVVVNLVSNAIKYNHKGGSVEISTEVTDNDSIRILVKDTGPGIPEENFKNLFQPFNRLAAEGSGIEGTGIGLSIARKLIDLMSGQIGLESTVGEGS
ncbi:MAG: PAS domain S-box protein, partial [Rhodospirillales bacterium]|nr:PAS domain S-box protein [Rhodospirillales bacterium]